MAGVEGRLAGRAALVTGTSSGIGRSIALRLATDGAKILCCDLQEYPREYGYDEMPEVPTHELICQRGGEAMFQPCDVGDEQSLEEAFGRAASLSAPLRICVFNAGIWPREVSILDETVEEHDRIMRVNERGVWLGCRAAGKRFAAGGDGGRIVCIGSIAGMVGLRAEPAYCASKGAVINLVRAVALDLAPYRINVNAVCPGFIESAMTRKELENPDQRAELERVTPWPRFGSTMDVAAAVCFLVSDDAAWITGVALPVDGGYTCG